MSRKQPNPPPPIGKRPPPPPAPPPPPVRSEHLLAEPFDSWWAKNHPFDWWSSNRDGIPLPHLDRLLVRAMCKRAYEANTPDERQQ